MYIYTYIPICIYIYIHICVYMYLFMYTYMYIYIYIHMYEYKYMCMYMCVYIYTYGVATSSRLLEIIGLFCRIQSLLQGSFAKETKILSSLLLEATPQVCKYKRTYACACTCIYIDIYHTHTHTHTHTHIHVIYSNANVWKKSFLKLLKISGSIGKEPKI